MKRVSEHQLTQDSVDLDDEDAQDSFQKADSQTLARRTIKPLKRRSQGISQGISSVPAVSVPSVPMLAAPVVSTEPTLAKLAQEVRGLNASFESHLRSSLEKDCFADLSSLLSTYQSLRKGIIEKYPSLDASILSKETLKETKPVLDRLGQATSVNVTSEPILPPLPIASTTAPISVSFGKKEPVAPKEIEKDSEHAPATNGFKIPAFSFAPPSTEPKVSLPSTPAKPTETFAFARTSKETTASPFGFPAGNAKKDSTPSVSGFSFGMDKNEEKVGAPVFNFTSTPVPSTPAADKVAPVPSFGTSAAFSFGSTPFKKEEETPPIVKPAVSAFASIGAGASTAPAFAFGQSATASTSFGSTAFGSTSFGSSAFGSSALNSLSTKPFSFGAPASTSILPTPTPTNQSEETGQEQGDQEGDAMPPEAQLGDSLLTSTAGEESETTLFSERSKIYQFDQGAWVVLGLGLLKVNQNTETHKSRLILRADSGRIHLNASIFKQMSATVTDKQVKMSVSLEAGKMTTLSARFKTEQQAQALVDAIDKVKENA